jgi:predicted esterase
MVPESVFKFFGWFPFRTLSQILFLASPLVHSYTASCDGYIEQHTEKSTNDGRVKIHKLGDDRSSHIFFTMTKSKSSDDGANRPIIIYAKGNNWDLGSFHRRPYMVSPSNPVASKVNTSLAEIMVNSTGGTVFCFEYPGYGIEDASKVSTQEAPEYMKRMIEHLRSIYPHRPIVLWGYSLGAAVTLRTLELLGSDAEKWVNGAILQSSFVSIRDIDDFTLFQKMVMWSVNRDLEKYDNYGLLRGARKAGVPIAWIHGKKDKMCPMDAVIQKVYSQYSGQKLFLSIENAAHNNLPLSEEWDDTCKIAMEFVTSPCPPLP